MNPQFQNDGGAHVSGFVRVVTNLLTSTEIACALALLGPPPARRAEDEARPGPSSPETPGLHRVGARR